jgi:hypothetical protein
MDGEVMWQWITTHRPELATRVMFMTGDATGVDTERFLEEASRPVLKKPMAIDEIKRMVNAMLAAGGR